MNTEINSTMRTEMYNTKRDFVRNGIAKMEKNFSIFELYRHLRDAGCPEKWLRNQNLNSIILDYAGQVSPKTYMKKSKSSVTPAPNDNFENECIEFLKEKGYKIMKPVQEFIEL